MIGCDACVFAWPMLWSSVRLVFRLLGGLPGLCCCWVWCLSVVDYHSAPGLCCYWVWGLCFVYYQDYVVIERDACVFARTMLVLSVVLVFRWLPGLCWYWVWCLSGLCCYWVWCLCFVDYQDYVGIECDACVSLTTRSMLVLSVMLVFLSGLCCYWVWCLCFLDYQDYVVIECDAFVDYQDYVVIECDACVFVRICFH